MTVNIFQIQIKKMPQTDVLFSIDLRIDKKSLKLKVTANDTLTDLIEKLGRQVTWREIPHSKMKTRLEEQIKKIVDSQKLSANVSNKLHDLIEESKFVIVGIETENRPDEETPFKILQESTLNGRKLQEKQKHFQYLNQSQAASLRVKYESKQLQTAKQNFGISQRRGSSSTFQRSVKQSKSKYSPQKYSYLVEEKQPELISYPLPKYDQILPLVSEQNDDSLQKKYEAIDRKCQEYIVRNVSKSEKMRESYDRYQQNKEKLDKYQQFKPQEKGYNQRRQVESGRAYYDPEIKVKKFDDSEEIRQDERAKYQLEQKIFNKRNLFQYQNQNDYNGESFQQYKVNRHKSTSNFQRPPLLRDDYKPEKMATWRDQSILPSKSMARLSKHQQTQELVRQYPQSSSCNLRRDPNKKFNYLSQAI